jgi:Ran-binding protein 1
LDKGTGNKTWRERGIGEVKILQHKEHKKYRILMRQEKTMKIICNHIVDPRIEMQPQMSSDKAMMWSAFDFADGELVETIFAIRFPNSDVASEFKAKFEECQADMKKILEAEAKEEPPKDAEAEAAADETAEKLAALKTSD